MFIRASRSLFSTICCAFVLFTVASANIQVESPADWDYFVYTQQWPQAACQDAETSHHTCKIANNITTWTIHGLWPNKSNTTGPNYCNNATKFQFSQILALEGRMLKFWPNLYSDTALDSFWEHEWIKHGTCAASLPALKGEYNYFSAGLQLNKKYDLLSLLQQQGIVPTAEKTYQATALEAGLLAALQKRTLIRCTYNKQLKHHMLMEVEMCFDKTISLIDCPACVCLIRLLNPLSARDILKVRSNKHTVLASTQMENNLTNIAAQCEGMVEVEAARFVSAFKELIPTFVAEYSQELLAAMCSDCVENSGW